MNSAPLNSQRDIHTPKSLNIKSQHKQKSRRLNLETTLSLLAFIVNCAAALYLVFDIHYYAGDALSRVGNAYYVLFSRNPHLGAIGFVWNPLPSVMEIPLVALHPWFPSVVTRGLAGSFVSAILGSIGVYHMAHILKNMDLPAWWRTALTLCFALNPLIVLYGANGMSDIMWVACMLGTYSGLFDYLKTGSLRRLVAAAFWLSAGLGMRYEAVPFGLLVIIAAVLGQWGTKPLSHIQGSAILLGTPIVFGGGIWIYFNWIIMKNPLYFLNSSYGNLAQTATGAYMTSAMIRAHNHIFGAILYVVRFGLLYWPIYPAFLVTLWYCFGKNRDSRGLILIAGTIGAELLELVFAYEGHLGQWDRYFLEFIPNGILLGAFAAHKIFSNRESWSKNRVFWTGLVLSLVFFSGSVLTVKTLQVSYLGHSDGPVLDAAFQNQSLQHTGNNPFYGDKSLIRYIDNHPHLSILADTFVDWPVIVRAKRLNQFTITSDYNFASILHNPKGRIAAFLVPEPVKLAQLDAINRVWPGLWAGHESWTRLTKSFPGGNNYKLYGILPSAP
ncbi:MAG: glycosyltransferase family 39 protein [Firmicutes bacterium]|jgi:hypothetical protein|nr:glycosyltransferase family 39 protein [Bacillota bacterium]MCL5013945.1 glycosyltransferase family 39 protein [Bacillota bacterium]